MTVLVLAERTDTTADLVVRELNERGAVVFRCDAAEFPTTLSLSAHLDLGDARWRGRLRTAHRAVALEDVTGVYFRRPTLFRLPEQMSAAERRFAAVEAKMGLGGVLMSLPCRWVNHPSRIADAEYKPLQLVAAARTGLRVPATLVTNDPGSARGFAADGGPVVYKTLASPAVPDGDHVGLIYTTAMSRNRMDDERIGLTAHLFQRRITKRRDVRVTIVGERVFAVDIHVEGSSRAMLDWRADYAAHRYEVMELPPEIAKRLTALVRGLGLRFAAIDLIVDGEDQEGDGYVLVDVNPNGQWGWLQEATGLPIAAAIAEDLTGSAEARR